MNDINCGIHTVCITTAILVIFFLFRLREIALYVSLFSLGHSITLLAEVFFRLEVDAQLVDAVIGLSVVYKAFENLGGFRTLTGRQPDTRLAVFAFGSLNAIDNPEDKIVLFMALDNVKWRRPVTPGDQIRFEVEVLQIRARTARMKGLGILDGQVVAEAEMMARVGDR